jgi:hypothetical protein
VVFVSLTVFFITFIDHIAQRRPVLPLRFLSLPGMHFPSKKSGKLKPKYASLPIPRTIRIKLKQVDSGLAGEIDVR